METPPPIDDVPPPPPEPSSGRPSPEECTIGMLCHAAAFVGFAIPLGNFLGPLVVWLIKSDTMPFVDDQGREAMNFNISFGIYFLVSLFSLVIGIGFVLLPVVVLFWLVTTIVAAVKAGSGEAYRYPLCLRLFF